MTLLSCHESYFMIIIEFVSVQKEWDVTQFCSQLDNLWCWWILSFVKRYTTRSSEITLRNQVRVTIWNNMLKVCVGGKNLVIVFEHKFTHVKKNKSLTILFFIPKCISTFLCKFSSYIGIFIKYYYFIRKKPVSCPWRRQVNELRESNKQRF